MISKSLERIKYYTKISSTMMGEKCSSAPLIDKFDLLNFNEPIHRRILKYTKSLSRNKPNNNRLLTLSSLNEGNKKCVYLKR